VLFWHTGGTIAGIRYAFRDDRMDLRFLVLGAVLADLMDTPIGLVFYATFGAVRLVGHSFLFAAVAMLVVLLTTRRGRPRKRWMPVAVGILVHLLLDAMWVDPETLWWPFFGLEFSAAGPATAADYVVSIVTDWRVWAMEAAGLAYVAYLWRRGRLGSRAARADFLRTGVVDVPIDGRRASP
jgi:membrane-bound metal-dependent hydrolase YbcI (DUF457 family)